ncbi:DUF4238 domain-containing protein [Burkholderia stagnalis]
MPDQELTRSQHYVPRIYQKGWAPGKWQTSGYPKHCTIWAHDLACGKAFAVGPNGMLTSNWFYEANPDKPDNEFETWFHSFETDYTDTIRFLDEALTKIEALVPAAQLGRTWESALSTIMQRTPSFASTLKAFAAVCYARTPEIMAHKAAELAADPRIDEERAREMTTPYAFVNHFRESTLTQRFLSLHLQVMIAPEGGLVTCDRPCYDFMDLASETWPLAGYDIGRRDNVAALMPLSHQLALLLTPPILNVMGRKTRYEPFSTRVLSGEEVSIVNAMTVNMAGRWVIGNAEMPEVFSLRTRPKRSQ